MKCPIDTNIDLVMTDRSGIEIDYCPTCRGVWLDRGELDKIIERNVAPGATTTAGAVMAATPAIAPAAKPKRWNDDHDDRNDRDDRDDRDDRPRYGYDDDKKYKKKKRSSFLEEIFDF